MYAPLPPQTISHLPTLVEVADPSSGSDVPGPSPRRPRQAVAPPNLQGTGWAQRGGQPGQDESRTLRELHTKLQCAGYASDGRSGPHFRKKRPDLPPARSRCLEI